MLVVQQFCGIVKKVQDQFFTASSTRGGAAEHLIQRWAGWASRDMMEVYGNAIGQEERTLARRLWE